MSSDDPKQGTTKPKASSIQIHRMSEDRPLDALFPELQQPYAPNDAAAQATTSVQDAQTARPILSSNVLDVELEQAQRFVLSCWRTSHTSEEPPFEASLRGLLSATLLQELSRPPGWGEATHRRIEGVDLFVFDTLSQEQRDSLARLGFVQETFDPLAHGNRLHAWQNEARMQGWGVPGEAPTSLWYAPLRVQNASQDTLTKTLREAHEEIARRHDARLWGAFPGEPSHTLASILERELQYKLSPDMKSLQELDALVIERATHAIRWIEPMVFQALCDFMGIVLMASKRARVQWGVCESDRHGGHLPPLLRLADRGGVRDVEVGLALLEHAIMPRSSEPEPLASWFERVFFP